MAPITAEERLQWARARIRQAMEQWNPADLDGVDESRQLLSLAVEDMRAFDDAMRAGSVPSTEELCATLLATKQEIGQAARVVDACVAFHRGLAARLGETAPGYDASGNVAEESTPLEHEMHG